ncbi:MAG: hypothetical protein HFG27_03680 [Provencibacterium sp.]|jgi:hypothetical protein|nr:hypothetical protein [Provencibacterium sp.]
MRSFRNSEIFKRVIPLTLAGIVLAGTLLGIFGTIFAYAADAGSTREGPGNVKLSTVSFFKDIDDKDTAVGLSELIYQNSYDIRISLRVDMSKLNLDDPADVRGNIKSVILNGPATENGEAAQGDFRPINGSDGRFRCNDYGGAYKDEKGNVYIDYELKSVQVADYDSTGWATLAITVQYDNGDAPDQLSRNYQTDKAGRNDWSGYDDTSDSGNRGTSTNDTSDAEVLTTPKMIVTGFNIPPAVNPGEEFQVTIEFMNNSKKKDMENVSMTLSPSDGVAIKNGVNKRHYIKIPKRQSTSETFTLKSSKELKAESLSLTVKFDYQYEVDNTYKDGSSEEILSISAIPKEEEKEEDTSGTEGSISSFEILSIVPPDSLYPNEDGYVTVKVINKDHQYDASNVQLTVVGDGLVNSGNTEYHGALTHSTQAEIEMALQFAEAGTYSLQAIVTYEDSVGKDDSGKPKVRINDLTKDFTVTVQESPDMGMDMGIGDMMGMGGMELDENGMPVGGEGMEMPAPWYKNPVILGCSGGGLVIVAVVVILLVRRARKKKAGEDDEDI